MSPMVRKTAEPLKILTVVGARPQFVKAAVLSRAIAASNARGGPAIEEQILHTGQHYDPNMSGAFFTEMEIPVPAVNLEIHSGNHGEMTGAMLAGIEREIVARRPDWVLVYGDTNSTLAGALAAVKLHVPVAHVEAGLRSYNRRMPEEINRVVTDHVSTVLFCPSEAAGRNLAGEGITKGVCVVGDVMCDAAMFYRGRAVPPPIEPPFGLVTLHRAENTDDPARLARLLDGLARSPVPLLFPVHPRTRKVLERTGLRIDPKLRLVEPLSYFAILGALDACDFVATDSGGLQKEAYFFGKRCITLRTETEWTELVETDANRIVGDDPAAIAAAFDWAGRPLDASRAIYGSGDAGDKIVSCLLEHAG